MFNNAMPRAFASFENATPFTPFQKPMLYSRTVVFEYPRPVREVRISCNHEEMMLTILLLVMISGRTFNCGHPNFEMPSRRCYTPYRSEDNSCPRSFPRPRSAGQPRTSSMPKQPSASNSEQTPKAQRAPTSSEAEAAQTKAKAYALLSTELQRPISALSTPCSILGVSERADKKAIVKAYRDLGLKYHPDKRTKKHDEDKDVAREAWEIVKNAYDKALNDLEARTLS